MLLGAVAIVLLIACANVANLFMVRAEGRHRDLAVRRAIGATRSQLVRLQMAEALVVALLAGGLAVLLAVLTLPALPQRGAARTFPGWTRLASTRPRVLVTLSAVLLSALACGTVPALRASEPDLRRLREGGRGATGKRHWGRDALVVGQTALALVLLIGSGLLVRSFQALRHVDPGYDTKDVFTFQFAPGAGPAERRPDLGAIPSRFHEPAEEPAGCHVGRPGGERSAQRRHPDGTLRVAGASRCGERHSAQLHLDRRRLLPDHGDSRASGAGPSLRTRPPACRAVS